MLCNIYFAYICTYDGEGPLLVTYADIDDLEKDIGFKPQTTINEGIGKFVDWYKEYYRLDQDSSD